MTKRLCGVMGIALLVLAGEAYASVDFVPEIDGGSAVTALSLLIGVITLAAERLRHRR